jgi:hypothetical protein
MILAGPSCLLEPQKLLHDIPVAASRPKDSAACEKLLVPRAVSTVGQRLSVLQLQCML